MLHFRVVCARGDRSREGSISKLSLEVKTTVSGFEISPEGEERIIDTHDVITLVSRMPIYVRTENLNCARSGSFSQIRSHMYTVL